MASLDAEDEMTDTPQPIRRTRSGAEVIVSTLPKSTRKTRSKKVDVVLEEAEEKAPVNSFAVTANMEDLISEVNENYEKAQLLNDENVMDVDSQYEKSMEHEGSEEKDNLIFGKIENVPNDDSDKSDGKCEGVELDDDQCNARSSGKNSQGDTEVISEDELPSVEAIKVPEAEEVSDDELPGPKRAELPAAEEVSDDELPGPKRAELPADTEVVSEDEFPNIKKAGMKRKMEASSYDPSSPTSENESNFKKVAVVQSGEIMMETAAIEKNDNGEFVAADNKDKEKDKKDDKNNKDKTDKNQSSKLPELDKYWKAVNDDPTDFTGWTYLLQYVDQINDIEAAREAYDAFLSHYPYCYGYWRKYADYEKRKGNKKKCEEVFERGLKAIPLSVDLWLHFLNYTKATYGDNDHYVREQFERAIDACGLEFRSDRLWDMYIKFETDKTQLEKVLGIYDRLLTTPTQGYSAHFDSFTEFVSNNAPNEYLNTDEFLGLRKDIRPLLKKEDIAALAESADIPPGEDLEDKTVCTDDESKLIKERVIASRKKIHKQTMTLITARWNYEEGIKRPYFHVKPLERCQLKNWKEYLDFEIAENDKKRIVILFERCLIACALYEEFWLRYVKYLEDREDSVELIAQIRDVYERACTIHHVGKPALNLAWAMYEESVDNYNKANEIYINLEKTVPNLVQIAYRRINMERRRNDMDKCAQLYEHYITSSKNKVVSSNMAIKYARFVLKVQHDREKAVEILQNAISKDYINARLYLQLIDLELQRKEFNSEKILALIDQFVENPNADHDQKILFAQRKLEFLEDFGRDLKSLQHAYEAYQKILKQKPNKLKKDDDKSSAMDPSSQKKLKSDAQPPLPSNAAPSYGNYGPNYNANMSSNNYGPYSGPNNFGPQYGPGQYSQGDQYQYQNWQYPQSGGYGNYNQWGGYGNYY